MSISESLGLLQFIVVIGGGIWAASKFKVALDYLTKDFSKLEAKFDSLDEKVRESHEKWMWDLQNRVVKLEEHLLKNRERGI